MTEIRSFQDMILTLVNYWKDNGCLVWQPYNVRVGAGTNNPATALRVLGPEPWNVVYVEPSVRPDDGRFGDNPNRMQQHTQLQVILQPDPGNPQELFLQSLAAIGIDAREHDIRFVEDNWESPALGAWGLGWEVWLDGQEITQFTYFQQAGSINLDPVAVEITYGLDRIALALQRTSAVWDMEYGNGISYGDLLLQAEIEQCRYYFDIADVDTIWQMFRMSEQEAQRCIAAGLVVPAHDYNLQCSHLFNVLDTRGAIGVTERAESFRRMRNLARQISDLYLQQRQQLEYPLLDSDWAATVEDAVPEPLPAALPATAQDFVLEIGSEELPAADLTAALAQLEAAVPVLLDELRLGFESVSVAGTPRRLAVIVRGLAARQSDLESEVKGPPANRAFDSDGNPTRAAAGFARGRGVAVEALKVITEGDKQYVAALVFEQGQPAPEVLAAALPDLVAGLKFPRSMRWNQTNVAYSRPLRWLLALYGPVVVPFVYAGIASGRSSRGLRAYGSPLFSVADAADYEQTLAEQRIMLSVDARRAVIVTRARALAESVGGTIPDDAGLLEEVTNLNEAPTPLLGSFEARYLALPPEVLVAVMRKHQRYFPLYGADQQLLPYFITVRNGDEAHLDIVRDGNEQVIRARFADAEFFYQNDIKKELADFVPELAPLTFQKDLGSMLDKTERLQTLAPVVAGMLGADEETRATVARVAALGKADLATHMVVEMTSLQGIMGGHYARLNGEPEAVAAAIAVQYAPVTPAGAALAYHLADRLDSLVGLFAVGMAPKGSNDPFALRRAAIQIIENLVANEVAFDLGPALAAAATALPIPTDDAVLAEVAAFVTGRLEVVLRDSGAAASVAKAVLAEQAHNPYAAVRAAQALTAALADDDWQSLLDAYARCVRITRREPEQYALRPADLAEADEQALYAAYQDAAATADGSVPTLIAGLRRLRPTINQFFDNLLVNADDPAVRANRLALLQHIAGLTAGIADLSQLEGF